MTYKIQVRDNLISVTDAIPITSGNKDNIAFEFDFLNGWEEYQLKVCSFIRKGQCMTALIEDNQCVVPYELMKKPADFKMGVFGADENMEKRISTNLLEFSVEPGAYKEDAQIALDAPTEIWEELVLKTVPKIGENKNWYLWDIKTQSYVDTGIYAAVDNMEKLKNKTTQISDTPSDEMYPSEKAVADYILEKIEQKAPRLIFESEEEMYKYLDENHSYMQCGQILKVARGDYFNFDTYNKMYLYVGSIIYSVPNGIWNGYETKVEHTVEEIYPASLEFKSNKVASPKGLSENSTDEQYPSAKAVVDYVSEKTKKANVITSIATTLTLKDKQDAQLGTITSMKISVPDAIDKTYESCFSFTAGNTITLTCSGTPIIFRGDDCNGDGVFTPVGNTMYEISAKYVNTNSATQKPVIVARVGVV